MLDVALSADPRFSAASASIALVFFALFGSFFLFTQLLQFVLGYSALEAGLRLLPVSVVIGIVSPVSARLVELVGTKVVVAAGLVVAALGSAIASTLSVSSGYGRLLASMVVLALGISLTMAPATESIMGSLPAAKAGVGSAVNDTTRELGGALGVAVLGSLLASDTPRRSPTRCATSPSPPRWPTSPGSRWAPPSRWPLGWAARPPSRWSSPLAPPLSTPWASAWWWPPVSPSSAR